MRAATFFVLFLVWALYSQGAYAEKKVRYKKTQSVDFEGDSVEGVRRSPYGAYVTQNRGVDFAPLYKLKTKFDTHIKTSVDYVR